MSQRSVVDDLLTRHGTTYASAAGIKLADKPSPLFELLVLTMLSSTRISADIAVAAARELFASGWRTPEKMRKATWQQRVDARPRPLPKVRREHVHEARGAVGEGARRLRR